MTAADTTNAQLSYVEGSLAPVAEELTLTDLDVSEVRELTTASAPTMLDPHGGRRGPIDAGWGLILNTSVEPEA